MCWRRGCLLSTETMSGLTEEQNKETIYFVQTKASDFIIKRITRNLNILELLKTIRKTLIKITDILVLLFKSQ